MKRNSKLEERSWVKVKWPSRMRTEYKCKSQGVKAPEETGHETTTGHTLLHRIGPRGSSLPAAGTEESCLPVKLWRKHHLLVCIDIMDKGLTGCATGRKGVTGRSRSPKLLQGEAMVQVCTAIKVTNSKAPK